MHHMIFVSVEVSNVLKYYQVLIILFCVFLIAAEGFGKSLDLLALVLLFC